MSKVFVIPWGTTDWSEQKRIIGNSDITLNEAGRGDIASLAEQLAAESEIVIQPGPEEAARESAKILAGRLARKSNRAQKKLHELDMGIWKGLTEAEISQRFTRAWDLWSNHPESFHAPDGEAFNEAMERVCSAADKIVKKNRKEAVAFVVGPIAAAMLTSHFSGRPFTECLEEIEGGTKIEAAEWSAESATKKPH